MTSTGIPVPGFTRERRQAQDWVLSGKTVLGRRDHGFGGRDIQVYRQGSSALWDFRDFYTVFIPNTREYRVHVFQGEPIRIQGKYLDYPDKHTNPHIKNYAQGFRFRTPDRSLRPGRLDDAIRAVDVLGLDFGAVDLIVGEDGNHYILEVNTAPSCCPMTARSYVSKFAELLDLEPRWSVLEQRELVAHAG